MGQLDLFPIVKSAAPSTSATNYHGLCLGSQAWGATETNFSGVIPGSGTWTLQNWYIRLTTAPGGVASYAFTLRVNEADTLLAVTITGSATTGSDLTHAITLNPGDRVTIKCIPTGTPAGTGVNTHVWQMVADGANKTVWFTSSNSAGTIGSAATQYAAPQNGTTSTVENTANAPCPTAGVISQLYVDTESQPGSGKNLTVTLMVDGVASTLTCAVNGTGTTANDTTHSVTVAAGNKLDFKVVNDSGAATNRFRIGVLFAPNDGCETVFLHGAATMVQNQTAYAWGPAGGNTTEANRQCYSLACVISKIYIDATGAGPASGQTITLTLRVNAATPTAGPTCVITGTGLTANDTAHQTPIALLDLIDMQFIMSATTGTVNTNWGAVMMVMQPEVQCERRSRGIRRGCRR